MLLMQKGKRASLILLLGFCGAAWALDFDTAEKTYRFGHCKKAIQIGESVSRQSVHVPAQVQEDRNTRLQQWRESLRQCEGALPPEYAQQMERFLAEYREILDLRQGAAKTDAACELFRKVSLFTNDIKAATSDCPCRDAFEEAESMLRQVTVICPQPCKEIDSNVEDMLKELMLMSGNIKLSTNLLKGKQIQSFRTQIRQFHSRLLDTKQKADSLMESSDYCLGRKGNRNLGLIVGTSENLATGLAFIDKMCGTIQSMYRKAEADAQKRESDAQKEKLFRDSIDTFFGQVNDIVDQWLAAHMPTDQTEPVALQKSTADRMHDMLFRLAKIDLERSLYLLDRPIPEKKAEIARLRNLSFEGPMSPQEKQELTELRNKVLEKLRLSIPWTVRFWEARRATAIAVLCIPGVLIIAAIAGLVLRRRSKRNRDKTETVDV